MVSKQGPDLQELLIRLDEGQKFIIQNIHQIQDTIKVDKADATSSRRRMHERIEHTNRDLRELEDKVILIGQIATQQQDNIRSLSEQIKPVMQRWEDLRTAGKFFSWVLVILGVSGTTLFFTAREWLAQVLRRVFGL